jgi:Uma2 family endonuclease
MATAIETREYTPEELLAIRDRPMPELIDGQLVEREMSQKSDAIALNIGAYIRVFVREHNLGLVNGSQGSYQIFPDDPRRVRIPDASFTRKDRIPGGPPEEGHGRIPPDLVVEVVSPNDMAEDVNAKVEDFLNAGVPQVWVLYPQTETVHVFRSPRGFEVVRRDGTLDGGDILPGFRVPVRDLFKV